MPMKIITRKGKAEVAADRWYQTCSRYFDTPQDISYFRPKVTKKQIWENLKALEDPTPEQVNEIIGNSSWTDVTCHNCGMKSDVVIRLGQEPDYESSTACVCLGCLHAAVALATGETE